MTKVQARTLKTRAKLLSAAQEVVSIDGYEALRVERVVTSAGVAKGTFFAHFRDKDALMEQLIAPEIDRYLDQIEQLPAPQSVAEVVDALMPMIGFITRERYVFDVILRHSGAAAKEDIGPIAQNFFRSGHAMTAWLSKGRFRNDISAELLAGGVGAFLMQAIALNFCALQGETPIRQQLLTYLQAWLQPTP